MYVLIVQPWQCVYVCRLADKHSMYGYKATADISLVGVKIPLSTDNSAALKASLHMAGRTGMWWREGGGGEGDGIATLEWSVK